MQNDILTRAQSLNQYKMELQIKKKKKPLFFKLNLFDKLRNENPNVKIYENSTFDILKNI